MGVCAVHVVSSAVRPRNECHTKNMVLMQPSLSCRFDCEFKINCYDGPTQLSSKDTKKDAYNTRHDAQSKLWLSNCFGTPPPFPCIFWRGRGAPSLAQEIGEFHGGWQHCATFPLLEQNLLVGMSIDWTQFSKES